MKLYETKKRESGEQYRLYNGLKDTTTLSN